MFGWWFWAYKKEKNDKTKHDENGSSNCGLFTATFTGFPSRRSRSLKESKKSPKKRQKCFFLLVISLFPGLKKTKKNGPNTFFLVTVCSICGGTSRNPLFNRFGKLESEVPTSSSPRKKVYWNAPSDEKSWLSHHQDLHVVPTPGGLTEGSMKKNIINSHLLPSKKKYWNIQPWNKKFEHVWTTILALQILNRWPRPSGCQPETAERKPQNPTPWQNKPPACPVDAASQTPALSFPWPTSKEMNPKANKWWKQWRAQMFNTRKDLQILISVRWFVHLFRINLLKPSIIPRKMPFRISLSLIITMPAGFLASERGFCASNPRPLLSQAAPSKPIQRASAGSRPCHQWGFFSLKRKPFEQISKKCTHHNTQTFGVARLHTVPTWPVFEVLNKPMAPVCLLVDLLVFSHRPPVDHPQRSSVSFSFPRPRAASPAHRGRSDLLIQRPDGQWKSKQMKRRTENTKEWAKLWPVFQNFIEADTYESRTHTLETQKNLSPNHLKIWKLLSEWPGDRCQLF